MKTLISSLLLFIMIVTSNGLLAQDSWTLEDCINHALQNNIQLKRSELQVESAHKDVTQSAFEMGPNLSGFYNHSFLDGTTFNQYSLRFESLQNQSGSLGIVSEVTLFDGFNGINNRSRLKYQLESRRQDAEILKNDITLNVVAGFLQVLMDTEQHKLAREQFQVSQVQLKKADSQRELGTISQSDYLNIKSQNINQQAQLTSAANRLKFSNLELAHLLELDNPEDFEIDLTPITLSESHEILAFDNLFEEIAQGRPELRKAEYQMKSAQKSLSMAYGQLTPRVTLGYQLGSGYDQTAWFITPDSVLIEYPDYTYRNQIQDYIQHRVYFRVSIPIFQKFSNLSNISKSKIQVLDAKYAVEEAEKQVYREIQTAFADAISSWDNYLAYKESAESFKELYNQTVKRFELGTASALDVSLAQNDLIKAEGELLHAKYNYVLRVKILDFYRGLPITL
ncbi:MAG: TolC family protein [Bacteroidales bacterium]